MIFEFAWIWILLLLPLPLLMRWWRQAPQSHAPLANVSLPLIHTIDEQPSKKRSPRILLPLCWILLLLAAARPQWVDEASAPIVEQGRDLLIAMDLSQSMELDDMRWEGVSTDRLTIVKNLLSEFVQQRRGDRLGLILFADHAYLQSPLTFDVDSVAQFIDDSVTRLVGKSTAIGEAIGMGVKQLMQLPNEQRVLILITDGQNTSGEVEPLEALQVAVESDVVIYTIGIGAESYQQRTLFGRRTVDPSADLDEALLKRIAEETGGQYYRAASGQQLAEIYQALNQLNPMAEAESFFRPRAELYPWPLSLACLLLTLQLVLPLIRQIAANRIALRSHHD